MQKARTASSAAVDAGNRIRDYAKLERVLSIACVFTPALLVAFDGGTIRDSISAYYDMTQNQVFYVPLAVVAILFVVNGLVKH